jgi:hypothetical protein
MYSFNKNLNSLKKKMKSLNKLIKGTYKFIPLKKYRKNLEKKFSHELMTIKKDKILSKRTQIFHVISPRISKLFALVGKLRKPK